MSQNSPWRALAGVSVVLAVAGCGGERVGVVAAPGSAGASAATTTAAALPASAAAAPVSSFGDCTMSPSASLDWLLGCWRQDEPNGANGENWQRDSAGILRGFNYARRGAELLHQERISISKDDGGYRYTASPVGQSTTTFTAPAIGANCADFRNPEHDFPQHVGYRLKGETLTAFIAGSDGGKPMQRSWQWSRVACPATPIPEG